MIYFLLIWACYSIYILLKHIWIDAKGTKIRAKIITVVERETGDSDMVKTPIVRIPLNQHDAFKDVLVKGWYFNLAEKDEVDVVYTNSNYVLIDSFKGKFIQPLLSVVLVMITSLLFLRFGQA